MSRRFRDYYNSPVRITARGGKQPACATAFFYSTSDEDLFLITNRHVVWDEENDYPTSLEFAMHTDPTDLSASASVSLPLYEGDKKKWLEHKNPEVDVVAIPLERSRFKDCYFYAFTPSDDMQSISESYSVHVGYDALVIGFPLGTFFDRVYNRPIVRNALIASEYPEWFEGKPVFVIDANLQKGLSGSPVVSKPYSRFETESGYADTFVPLSFLLGVLSAGCQDLGLNLVYYASLIPEIVRT